MFGTMQIRLTLVAPFAIAAQFAQPQQDASAQVVTFAGNTISATAIGTYPSSDARAAVARITNAVGLAPKFEILPASCNEVNNAEAAIYGSQRLIIYCESFMRRVADATRTDWAAISILAHEVGHHLNGHTLERTGSRPPIELEADEFSGFALARLGAGLDAATAAMRAIASPEGSATHPPQAQRVSAIRAGWNKAGGQIPAGGCSPLAITSFSLRNGGGRDNAFFFCDGRYYFAVIGTWDEGNAGFSCSIRIDRATDFTKIAESPVLTTKGEKGTVWQRRIPELGREIYVFLRGGRGPVCDFEGAVR